MDEKFIVINGLGLLLFGVGTLVSSRFLTVWRPAVRLDFMHVVMNVAAWTMIVVGFSAVGFLTVSVFIVINVIVALYVLFVVVGRLWLGRRKSLLHVLSAAVDRNVPLDAALEAHAQDCGPAFGSRVKRAAERIRGGQKLADALAAGHLVAGRDQVAIRLGQDLGNLADTLKQLSQQTSSWGRLDARIPASWGPFLSYVGLVVFVGIGVQSLLTYKLQSLTPIFMEFNQLPLATAQDLGAFLLHPIVLIVGGGLVAVCLVVALVTGLNSFGLTTYELPIVGAARRRTDRAEVLRILASAAQTHRSLPEVLHHLYRHHPSPWIRAKLAGMMEDVGIGRGLAESMADRSFCTHKQGAVLAAAIRGGHLPWALRNLAEDVERRGSFRQQAMIILSRPAILILVGIMVGLLAAGVLFPLARIIQQLAT